MLKQRNQAGRFAHITEFWKQEAHFLSAYKYTLIPSAPTCKPQQLSPIKNKAKQLLPAPGQLQCSWLHWNNTLSNPAHKTSKLIVQYDLWPALHSQVRSAKLSAEWNEAPLKRLTCWFLGINLATKTGGSILTGSPRIYDLSLHSVFMMHLFLCRGQLLSFRDLEKKKRFLMGVARQVYPFIVTNKVACQKITPIC